MANSWFAAQAASLVLPSLRVMVEGPALRLKTTPSGVGGLWYGDSGPNSPHDFDYQTQIVDRDISGACTLLLAGSALAPERRCSGLVTQ
jgi:hypothetical protein